MGNPFDLHDVLERHKSSSGTMDLRGFEWWYLAGHAQARRPVLCFPSEALPRLLTYSPDGEYLIAGQAGTPGQKTFLLVWDRKTDREYYTPSNRAESTPAELTVTEGK